MTAIYLVSSTFALAFVAAIWVGKGWPNIVLKAAFVGLTVMGAIVSATALHIAA